MKLKCVNDTELIFFKDRKISGLTIGKVYDGQILSKNGDARCICISDLQFAFFDDDKTWMVCSLDNFKPIEE